MTACERVVAAASVATDGTAFEFLLKSQYLLSVLLSDRTRVLTFTHHLAPSNHDAFPVGHVGVLAIDKPPVMLKEQPFAGLPLRGFRRSVGLISACIHGRQIVRLSLLLLGSDGSDHATA